MNRPASPPRHPALALTLLLLPAFPAAAQDNAGTPWRPPELVDAVASLGAAVHDGALYVYGGHVGTTHVHSMENISPGFRRLMLGPGGTWPELARGPLLQGTVLVSDGGALYRVGGMTASNASPSEPEVLHSNRSVARYSAAENRWEALPDLPAGRSSHDAVVTGGVLYVVGGWEMRGPDEESVWAETVLALDLDNAAGSGSNFASPFVYRDCVYWVNPAGAARCLAPDSGAVQWTHRLPASLWATPLGHQDQVYFFTEQGTTQVLRASADAPHVIATNDLSVDAPVTGFAAVDDAIVIRAGSEVIRVGRPMN